MATDPEFTPIAKAGLPGEPTVEEARTEETPDVAGADIPDGPEIANAGVEAPEITSALTGD